VYVHNRGWLVLVLALKTRGEKTRAEGMGVHETESEGELRRHWWKDFEDLRIGCFILPFRQYRSPHTLTRTGAISQREAIENASKP
jgi:hypothetical protein